jgi:hypothetical protein
MLLPKGKAVYGLYFPRNFVAELLLTRWLNVQDASGHAARLRLQPFLTDLASQLPKGDSAARAGLAGHPLLLDGAPLLPVCKRAFLGVCPCQSSCPSSMHGDCGRTAGCAPAKLGAQGGSVASRVLAGQELLLQMCAAAAHLEALCKVRAPTSVRGRECTGRKLYRSQVWLRWR